MVRRAVATMPWQDATPWGKSNSRNPTFSTMWHAELSPGTARDSCGVLCVHGSFKDMLDTWAASARAVWYKVGTADVQLPPLSTWERKGT